MVFYSQVKQAWTDIRGKYYVDYSVDPPEIESDATGPQPIQSQPGGQPGFIPKQKSSFYLPNPENGTTAVSPKEQDALILQLIEEYEKKQQLNKVKSLDQVDADEVDFSSQSGSGSLVSGDTEYTENNYDEIQPGGGGPGAVNNGHDRNITEYENSKNFELSDSDDDDPLYRQVSQMTSAQKQQLGLEANKEIKQEQMGSAYNDPNTAYNGPGGPGGVIMEDQQQQPGYNGPGGPGQQQQQS